MAVTNSSRIPPALQAVFIASNQGQVVHEPPKDGSAFKVFRRRGVRRNRSGSMMRHPFFEGLRSMFGKVSPRALFHRKLKDRGYYPKFFESKLSGYFNQPTPLQLASYGIKLMNVIKNDQTIQFRAMLEAGLSPNACNSHGESLLHIVCRQGHVRLFRILIEFGVDPRQTDDIGRTPLHEACLAATPCFEIVRWLIRSDPGLLFLIDERGSIPLDYVNKSVWDMWHNFIEESIDEFFPKSNAGMDITPGLWGLKPNSRPVCDPWNAISPYLACKIAAGELEPHELRLSVSGGGRGDDEEETIAQSASFYDDDESSSFDSDSEFSYDSECESDLHSILYGHRSAAVEISQRRNSTTMAHKQIRRPVHTAGRRFTQ